ncbi:PREDICTED: transcription factor bHLH52-like [Nelumbo nucifera]|uniref:BHLH domain-containing protein n=2 Tax=Nelumbo nucifera TaxID=4432 RepID=A0A822YFZ1_NELNU|nr:PREDICTED: transcription factor bHLH52-like [Nelumbo nucifera]DAD28438.1 TPA_asm: hypothetical protein HUJ06_029906 [Nelumbo nucifera]
MYGFQQEQPELESETLGFCDSIISTSTFCDPLPELDDFLCTPNHDNLLPPYYSSCFSDPLVSISPEIILPNSCDLCCQYQCHHSKRQKTNGDFYYSDGMLNCFDGFVPSSRSVLEFLPDHLLLPSTEIQVPPAYSSREVHSAKKVNERSLSAQSIAARQRRRKIIEKTQELEKLIPGVNKMNTADMFAAAFKYVKFLQAQVGILEVMGLMQETSKDQRDVKELQILGSRAIQEKLYLEEKCLVPQGFVKILAEKNEIQSNPSISEELNQFMQIEQ